MPAGGTRHQRVDAGRKRILRGPYQISARLTSAAHGALMRECRRRGVTPTDLINDLLEATGKPQAVALQRRRLW